MIHAWISNLSPELQADKIQQKQFFCQITKCSFEFLSFDNFSFSNFQVLLRRLKKLIFCQIIMGSQLNNNVSKGRSVQDFKRTRMSKVESGSKVYLVL